MTYLEQFKNITDIKELFDFKLKLEKESKIDETTPCRVIEQSELDKCNEAQYYLKLVEKRIEYLFSQGYSLDLLSNKAPKIKILKDFDMSVLLRKGLDNYQRETGINNISDLSLYGFKRIRGVGSATLMELTIICERNKIELYY